MKLCDCILQVVTNVSTDKQTATATLMVVPAAAGVCGLITHAETELRKVKTTMLWQLVRIYTVIKPVVISSANISQMC